VEAATPNEARAREPGGPRMDGADEAGAGDRNA
jgi:hypothetical protein